MMNERGGAAKWQPPKSEPGRWRQPGACRIFERLRISPGESECLADAQRLRLSAVPLSAAELPLDTTAHVVQVALTPVFLLSGIGVLPNLFNTRLADVTAHIAHTTELLAEDAQGDGAPRLRVHLRRLGQRIVVLDTAMILGALAGASTCGAAFTLFVGAMREGAAATGLFFLFGVALTCTVCALSAFIADSLLAWHGLHTEGPLPHMQTTIGGL